LSSPSADARTGQARRRDPLREAFLRFRDLVSADMDWVDSRKARFRMYAPLA